MDCPQPSGSCGLAGSGICNARIAGRHGWDSGASKDQRATQNQPQRVCLELGNGPRGCRGESVFSPLIRFGTHESRVCLRSPRANRDPILPGINIGRSFPFPDDSGPCAAGKRYEPVPSGGFAIHNGPDTYNHILMGDGVWYLLAGDKPRLRLLHRTGDSSYAELGILPGLGVGGRLRLAVANNGASKWLDQFESIDTQFAPGIAAWECSDQSLGVGLELETRPLIGVNGFIATATVHGDFAQAPHLTWAFEAIGDKNDSVELMKDFARLINPDLP